MTTADTRVSSFNRVPIKVLSKINYDSSPLYVKTNGTSSSKLSFPSYNVDVRDFSLADNGIALMPTFQFVANGDFAGFAQRGTFKTIPSQTTSVIDSSNINHLCDWYFGNRSAIFSNTANYINGSTVNKRLFIVSGSNQHSSEYYDGEFIGKMTLTKDATNSTYTVAISDVDSATIGGKTVTNGEILKDTEFYTYIETIGATNYPTITETTFNNSQIINNGEITPTSVNSTTVSQVELTVTYIRYGEQNPLIKTTSTGILTEGRVTGGATTVLSVDDFKKPYSEITPISYTDDKYDTDNIHYVSQIELNVTYTLNSTQNIVSGILSEGIINYDDTNSTFIITEALKIGSTTIPTTATLDAINSGTTTYYTVNSNEALVLGRDVITSVDYILSISAKTKSSYYYAVAVEFADLSYNVYFQTASRLPRTDLCYMKYGQFCIKPEGSEANAAGTIALKEEVYARTHAIVKQNNDLNLSKLKDFMNVYNSSMREVVKLINYVAYYNNSVSDFNSASVVSGNEANQHGYLPATTSTEYTTENNLIKILADSNTTENVQVNLSNIKFIDLTSANNIVTDSVSSLCVLD